MPDLRDLLNVGRAAATGFTTYQQAEQEQEAERRRRQQEDVDRAEQTRLRALEAMLADERLQEMRKGPQPTYGVGGDGRPTMSGARNPQQVTDFLERNPAPAEGSDVNWQIIQTPTGYARVNPRSGEAQPLQMGGQQVTPPPDAAAAAGRPTETQMRFSLGLARAEPALAQVEELLGEFGGSVPISSLGGRMPVFGQYLTPSQVQQYNQAAEAIASAILRAESGAAISAQEAQSYARQFLPAIGDRPDVIQQKLSATRETLGQMRALAGSAAGQQAPSPTTDASAPPATAPQDRWSGLAANAHGAGRDYSQMSDDELIQLLERR